MRTSPGLIGYAAWLTGVVLMLVLVSLLLPEQALLGLAHRVREWGFPGMLVFGALFVLTALLLLPGAPLIFLGGVLYGQWVGFLVVSIAATLAAGIAFTLAGTVAGRFMERKAENNALVKALVASAQADGFSLVVLARLSPLVPFSALNVIMGAAGLRLRTFLVASWLGKSPSIYAIVYAAQATDLTPGSDVSSVVSHVLFAVGIGATAYGTWRVVRVARRHLPAKAPPTLPGPRA